MNTSYDLNAYRSHELNIMMRTSSGDRIEFNFENQESASLYQEQSSKGTKNEAQFSSMQSFSFSIDSNGISEQDQKEIDAFMKLAQPYIDNFLKEFQESAPKSPVTRVAREIASAFQPSKERNEDQKNLVKHNIVKMFDNSVNNNIDNIFDKAFKQVESLLEKTLKEFDNFNKSLYA